MTKYRIEVTHGQDQREIEADTFSFHEGWMIFWRRPPQGGSQEYWRVRTDCVVCMETKP